MVSVAILRSLDLFSGVVLGFFLGSVGFSSLEDPMVAVKVVEMNVAIEEGFFGQDPGMDNLNGVGNKVVPFRTVCVNVRTVHMCGKHTSSIAVGDNGSKARISLFRE